MRPFHQPSPTSGRFVSRTSIVSPSRKMRSSSPSPSQSYKATATILTRDCDFSALRGGGAIELRALGLRDGAEGASDLRDTADARAALRTELAVFLRRVSTPSAFASRSRTRASLASTRSFSAASAAASSSAASFRAASIRSRVASRLRSRAILRRFDSSATFASSSSNSSRSRSSRSVSTSSASASATSRSRCLRTFSRFRSIRFFARRSSCSSSSASCCASRSSSSSRARIAASRAFSLLIFSCFTRCFAFNWRPPAGFALGRLGAESLFL